MEVKEKYVNPKALQDRVFEKLFDAAEIAKFSKEEKVLYEESLKYYRDIKNVVDTAKEEGAELKEIQAVLGLVEQGITVEIIAKALHISTQKVNQILEENKD